MYHVVFVLMIFSLRHNYSDQLTKNNEKKKTKMFFSDVSHVSLSPPESFSMCVVQTAYRTVYFLHLHTLSMVYRCFVYVTMRKKKRNEQQFRRNNQKTKDRLNTKTKDTFHFDNDRKANRIMIQRLNSKQEFEHLFSSFCAKRFQRKSSIVQLSSGFVVFVAVVHSVFFDDLRVFFFFGQI